MDQVDDLISVAPHGANGVGDDIPGKEMERKNTEKEQMNEEKEKEA